MHELDGLQVHPFHLARRGQCRAGGGCCRGAGTNCSNRYDAHWRLGERARQVHTAWTPPSTSRNRVHTLRCTRGQQARRTAGVVKDFVPARALRRTCGGRSAHVRLHAVLDFLRPVWENSTILTDPLFGGNLLVKFRADRIGNQYLT